MGSVSWCSLGSWSHEKPLLSKMIVPSGNGPISFMGKWFQTYHYLAKLWKMSFESCFNNTGSSCLGCFPESSGLNWYSFISCQYLASVSTSFSRCSNANLWVMTKGPGKTAFSWCILAKCFNLYQWGNKTIGQQIVTLASHIKALIDPSVLSSDLGAC